MTKTEKYTTHLEKAKSFCVYQERCVSDMKTKLREWKVAPGMMEKIIKALKKEDFIDEIRYAKAFAGGKFRIKKWGRNKIRTELRIKNISDHCIEEGLMEIDEDEYLKILQKLIDQKKSEFVDHDSFNNKNKIYIFAVNKGYERELILKYL